MALEAAAIRPLKQPHFDLAEVQSEQLALLTGHSMAEQRGVPGGQAAEEAVESGPVIAEQRATVGQALDLVGLEAEQPSSLAELEHPVTAYLNGLAPSSRRPQLAALEAIARRSTQIFSAETMPWQRLRRLHVLKIRSLLEENYLPATANRMLSALRGVLKESWHSGQLGMEEYRLAVEVEPVRVSPSRADAISQPSRCGICSRPARVRHRKRRIARTQSLVADATPPS